MPFSPRHTCEVPVELVRKKSSKDFLRLLDKYSELGDVDSVREILRDYAVPATTHLTNYMIRAHAENRDPISAQGVADEWKAAGNHLNNETMRILCDAYARASDPVGAERVALEAREAEFETGYYYSFFNCT